MLRYIQAFLIVMALAAVAGYGDLRLERSLLFKPTLEATGPTPESLGLFSEDVSFLAPDGVQLYGFYIPADSAGHKSFDAKRPVFLFCHGLSTNAANCLDEVSLLHAVGADVFIFDYRGYGRSEGEPSENGTYADADGAFTYLAGVRGIPPAQIVVFGESLGSGVAVETARRHPSRALILRSPFTSLPALVSWRYIFFVSWLLFDHYDNLSKIGSLTCPVLILHSTNDEIVPSFMGKTLFDAAREPKTFVSLRGSHFKEYRESESLYTSSVAELLRR